MAVIPENFLDLLQEKKAFAHLATVRPDGSPQVTPVWFDYEGGRIRVNTAKGRVKARNMKTGVPVALAIMVMSNREVQNRVVQLDRYYSTEELRRAANYLNEAFAGRSLPDVRAQLVGQLQETRQHMNQLMQDAIQMAQKVFDTTPDEGVEYVIAGETNLMGFAELSNVDRLRRLFEAFNEKHDILRLLDSCLRADGIQIFIGQESGYRILDDISVVTAPYTLDNRVVGVLGIIGPTRMAYERVIPIVDVTAKLLGSALNARK